MSKMSPKTTKITAPTARKVSGSRPSDAVGAALEHHHGALLGDPEGFLQIPLRIIIGHIDRDGRELRLFRESLEQRRLRTAGGAPPGAEHDSDRLPSGLVRIKLCLVEGNF